MHLKTGKARIDRIPELNLKMKHFFKKFFQNEAFKAEGGSNS